jgi:hypothetical protein
MGEDGGRSGAALLYEPASELRIAEDWYRRKALADLLQLEDEQQVNKDRLSAPSIISSCTRRRSNLRPI